MTNPKLASDHLTRARKRSKAVAVLLFAEEAFADVVRKSQEIVELVLKAVLRSFGIAVPFSHDLSETFAENVRHLPLEAQEMVPRWSQISKHLRKDRELAFYGSEDVTLPRSTRAPTPSRRRAWPMRSPRRRRAGSRDDDAGRVAAGRIGGEIAALLAVPAEGSPRRFDAHPLAVPSASQPFHQ